MKSVLILAHGSRRKETEETLASIAAMLERELGMERIEIAFLQFSEKNLYEGLRSLVEKGADDIKIVPYFLFEGVHIREDIPHEMREFQKEYPHVKIRLGKTLGADRRLALILKDKILEMI